MELVNNYIPGDQLLVDKIVYELKSQGIFDQFRKECFADVDTKPAYQNLRQRVENNVARFLRDQRWKPDMNKNQVREMLRKSINESGFLDIGVERIVDQVVNPKINSVFLPKVEEVVCSFLGIRKPKEENEKSSADLEAVSPEAKASEAAQPEIDDSTKMEEDESPPFEPLDERTYTQEDNSVDSHLSGFSGLVSHESSQSAEVPKPQSSHVELSHDSQSRHSSDSRLSVVTSDDNSKMDVCDESQLKTAKNRSEPEKKCKTDKYKTHRDDKDRRSGKDSKVRHSSSSSTKDRKDRREPKSGGKADKNKDRKSSTKHNSRDKDRDKEKSAKKHDSNRNHSTKHKSSDKHRKEDKHSHSNDKYKKDKDRRKDKQKDDHYSFKNKRNSRRSTDRDSNDGGHSGAKANSATENAAKNGQANESTANAEQTEKKSGETAKDEVAMKVNKPKFASNMKEAIRLMKIRKQLAKLERENQLSLAAVDVDDSTLVSASISLDDIKINGLKDSLVDKLSPVTSQDNWDKMEEKLRKQVDDCRCFEPVDLAKVEFFLFVNKYVSKLSEEIAMAEKRCFKRRIVEDDKNNNRNVKRTCLRNSIVKKNKEKLETDFPMPLSPSESDNSSEKKDDGPVKPKRNNSVASQRYSSDDLYKPRASFSGSRRRCAKNPDK